MSEITEVNIDNIYFKTGDILLVHGTSYWYERLIEWFTGSEYSHVAMVVKNPPFFPCKSGLFIIESSYEGCY